MSRQFHSENHCVSRDRHSAFSNHAGSEPDDPYTRNMQARIRQTRKAASSGAVSASTSPVTVPHTSIDFAGNVSATTPPSRPISELHRGTTGVVTS